MSENKNFQEEKKSHWQSFELKDNKDLRKIQRFGKDKIPSHYLWPRFWKQELQKVLSIEFQDFLLQTSQKLLCWNQQKDKKEGSIKDESPCSSFLDSIWSSKMPYSWRHSVPRRLYICHFQQKGCSSHIKFEEILLRPINIQISSMAPSRFL